MEAARPPVEAARPPVEAAGPPVETAGEPAKRVRRPATKRTGKPTAKTTKAARPSKPSKTPTKPTAEATRPAEPAAREQGRPRLRQPPQPEGTPGPLSHSKPVPAGGTDLLGTAVQAAAELAEIGFSLSARAVRSAVSKLPRP